MSRAKASPMPKREGTSRDLGLEAYSQLKEAIEDGVIVPGTRVTELDLCERFGMSRTPVREAIYRLESEGLLNHVPRRGLIVTQPDHQMIVELYTMREALEGTAAKLAAQHASDAELSTLAEINQQEPLLFADPRSLSRLNRRFHNLISMSAHNRYLLKNLENMASTIALLPTMLDMEGRPQEAHSEHRDILDAVQSRNAEHAEEAARAHIRSAGRRRIELLSRGEG
ncbi:GntR family transcriptional regulator [Aureimonas fodinaquatilis]|uniref:GntR family transcriptional regulator n=1 Tax=Aureimonas fodinaquatilis TaxID=2565783 RepID=A0A5B0DS60_9HYPH|nr:GntR family transcriptional regulator [Aureimonas fodinaquatilis]KAA0969336.1 GntR family transcriptional regulator [Aureimonas fodinaquatilis]